MSTQNSETPPDNISPHELDTRRDLETMSPDAIRKVQERRSFFRKAAAGIAGFGVLLKGGSASGQSTTVEDLLGSETAEKQKIIDKHDEEEKKKTSANKKIMTHAIDGLIEIAAHYTTQYVVKETVGRRIVNSAKTTTTSKANKKLNAIQRNAANDAVETPEKDRVVDALTRLKTSTENRMENAYVWKERTKDLGIVADWLIWAAREYNGQMNPVSGEFGGQIGRAIVLYQTIKQSGLLPGDKRDARMRQAKEYGKETASELTDQIDRSSRPVKTSIDKANTKKSDEKKVTEGEDAKRLKDAEKVEVDRQTDRREGVRRDHELELQDSKNRTELKKENIRATAETDIANKDRADAQRVRDDETTRAANEAELERLATEELARQDAFDAKRTSLGRISTDHINDPSLYRDFDVPISPDQLTVFIEAAIRKESGA